MTFELFSKVNCKLNNRFYLPDNYNLKNVDINVENFIFWFGFLSDRLFILTDFLSVIISGVKR